MQILSGAHFEQGALKWAADSVHITFWEGRRMNIDIIIGDLRPMLTIKSELLALSQRLFVITNLAAAQYFSQNPILLL